MRHALIAVLWMSCTVAHADFVLTGTEHLVVDTTAFGKLYDDSSADIVGGNIVLHVFDSATTTISGGHANATIHQTGTATINGGGADLTLLGGTVTVNDGEFSLRTVNGTATINGGTASGFTSVDNASTLNVAGGDFLGSSIYLHDYSTLNISGGANIAGLVFDDFSRAVIDTNTFSLSGQLTFDDGVLVGSGQLTGTWADDSHFSFGISSGDYPQTSTVWITGTEVPEPSTFILFFVMIAGSTYLYTNPSRLSVLHGSDRLHDFSVGRTIP